MSNYVCVSLRCAKAVFHSLSCWLISVHYIMHHQVFMTAEYPDLWPLAVDELLRVIADLAESVRDFIGAIESSNPSHQC